MNTTPYYAILTGKKEYRVIEGHSQTCTPFIGSVNFGFAGIGLIVAEQLGPIFYPFTTSEYKLIALCRAMMLLERMKVISTDGSTILACILLFHPEHRTGDNECFIAELAIQFGGEEGLKDTYSQVNEFFPEIRELEALLEYMHSRGVRIDLHEVRRELRWYEERCGEVFTLPILEKIRAGYELELEKIRAGYESLPEIRPAKAPWWEVLWRSLTLRDPWG